MNYLRKQSYIVRDKISAIIPSEILKKFSETQNIRFYNNKLNVNETRTEKFNSFKNNLVNGNIVSASDNSNSDTDFETNKIKWVHNLTDKEISNDFMDAISLGPNYCYSPK